MFPPGMDDKRGMDFLLEVSGRLTAAISTESLWQFIVSNVHDIIQANSSSIYIAADLSDPAGSDLKLQARKSEAPEKNNETREREIATQAWGGVEPFVLITDLESRSGLEAQIQVFTLVIPMCVNKVTVGVFIVERAGQSFLQSEVDFVNLAASLAAVTLHDNQMLQSEREQREFAEALRDSAEALTSTLSLDEVLDRILRDLRMVVHHDAAHVMLIEEGIAHVVRSSGYAEIGFEEMLLARKFPIHDIPHLQALAEQRKPITISNTRDSAEWTNLPEVSWIRSYAGAPIRIKEKTVGFLGVDSGSPGFFTERDAFRLQAFADQAAIALENARLYAHIQYLAMTDELTGLLNRRGLREKGDKEVARCRRYKRPLSAVLIDIDDFKRVNDRYGHAVGDQVIQFVAQNIKNQTRDVDLAARIGGDEMFVLLPETTAEQARAFAERIRLSIAKRPFRPENVDIFITLSLGVYRMAAEEDDFSSILVKIDRALYKAKQAGRNSVMFHEE